MTTSVQHATLEFEQDIAATPHAVFSAYADVGQRIGWGTPSDTAALIYDAADFREGGTDRFRCGPKDDPSIDGTTQYLAIAENRHIVSLETLATTGQTLAVALNTIMFLAAASGTRLVVTVQVASFAGKGMIEGYEQGHRTCLANLASFLSRQLVPNKA
jgi:uncharacterized protein YndB with AHSA1/START domain